MLTSFEILETTREVPIDHVCIFSCGPTPTHPDVIPAYNNNFEQNCCQINLIIKAF